MRVLFLAFAIALGVAACGPATGTNSAACRRAQEESRGARAQAQEAQASGGDSALRMAVERLERANAEMGRACEINLPPINNASASKPEPAVAEARPEPNTYFVSVDMTEERSEPGGGVV